MEVFPIRKKFHSKMDKYSWTYPTENMADYPVCFTILNNIISYNPNPNMAVPFLLVPLH